MSGIVFGAVYLISAFIALAYFPENDLAFWSFIILSNIHLSSKD